MEIEDLHLTGCTASDKLGASKDKYVLLDRKGAAVSFDMDVASDCNKNMTFHYSATKRNTRLNVMVNGHAQRPCTMQMMSILTSSPSFFLIKV